MTLPQDAFKLVLICPNLWAGTIAVDDFPTSNKLPGKMTGKANVGMHDLEDDRLKSLDLYTGNPVAWIFGLYAKYRFPERKFHPSSIIKGCDLLP